MMTRSFEMQPNLRSLYDANVYILSQIGFPGFSWPCHFVSEILEAERQKCGQFWCLCGSGSQQPVRGDLWSCREHMTLWAELAVELRVSQPAPRPRNRGNFSHKGMSSRGQALGEIQNLDQ